MICPLLTAGSVSNGYVFVDGEENIKPSPPVKCLKSKCGWYDGLFKECAIVTNGKRGH